MAEILGLEIKLLSCHRCKQDSTTVSYHHETHATGPHTHDRSPCGAAFENNTQYDNVTDSLLGLSGCEHQLEGAAAKLQIFPPKPNVDHLQSASVCATTGHPVRQSNLWMKGRCPHCSSTPRSKLGVHSAVKHKFQLQMSTPSTTNGSQLK